MNNANIVLYRGFDTLLPEGEIHNPYLIAPRKPKDSNVDIHEFADQWFQQRFGVAARSSTIICSTDLFQAADFAESNGCLAIISPIGHSRFIYSPYVRDFLQYATEGVTATQQSVWNWLDMQDYECAESLSDVNPIHKGEVMVSCEVFHLRYAQFPPNSDA